MICPRCDKPYPVKDIFVCPCHPMFRDRVSPGAAFAAVAHFILAVVFAIVVLVVFIR